MAVAWAVVRSLAGFPGAGPTGADYTGGVCLLLATGFVIWEFRYVDEVRSDYADTVPSLIMQIEGNSSSLRTPLRALFWTLPSSPWCFHRRLVRRDPRLRSPLWRDSYRTPQSDFPLIGRDSVFGHF